MVGKIRARKALYSPWSILRRLRANLRHPLVYLAMNWGHFKDVRVEEKRLALVKRDLYDKSEESHAPGADQGHLFSASRRSSRSAEPFIRGFRLLKRGST